MRKKVVILGANGMAGHVIYDYLRKQDKYEVMPYVRQAKLNNHYQILDVTSISELTKMVLTVQPDVIINAVGVLIKGSKSDVSNAILINSFLPHKLSSLSEKINAKLIHLSTDCVFKGNEKGGYTEDSFKDADDIYGRSKALGEVMYGNDITIRTSIIGPELKENGEGLLHWYLKSQGVISGFTKAFWSGITTLELAKVIDVVITTNVQGLCHVTNNQKITKFDMLQAFKEIWGKNGEIKENTSIAKDKSIIDTQNKINKVIPSYREMLLELKELMDNNRTVYSQYYKN